MIKNERNFVRATHHNTRMLENIRPKFTPLPPTDKQQHWFFDSPLHPQ